MWASFFGKECIANCTLGCWEIREASFPHRQRWWETSTPSSDGQRLRGPSFHVSILIFSTTLFSKYHFFFGKLWHCMYTDQHYNLSSVVWHMRMQIMTVSFKRDYDPLSYPRPKQNYSLPSWWTYVLPSPISKMWWDGELHQSAVKTNYQRLVLSRFNFSFCLYFTKCAMIIFILVLL